MSKQHFALRLIPSRPDFAQTMSDDERNIMMQHMGYWQEHLNKGMVVAFGPVLDPAGVYGLGIVAVDSEEQLQAFMAGDPAVAINRYEYHPMMATVREN